MRKLWARVGYVLKMLRQMLTVLEADSTHQSSVLSKIIGL